MRLVRYFSYFEFRELAVLFFETHRDNSHVWRIARCDSVYFSRLFYCLKVASYHKCPSSSVVACIEHRTSHRIIIIHRCGDFGVDDPLFKVSERLDLDQSVRMIIARGMHVYIIRIYYYRHIVTNRIILFATIT